jgi:NADP-dependent aldehyde dehydrogenase
LSAVQETDEEFAAKANLVTARTGPIIFKVSRPMLKSVQVRVHVGPFPANSDRRSNSAKTMGIYRFCRPVSWQSFPDAGLPADLQEFNSLGIKRMG